MKRGAAAILRGMLTPHGHEFFAQAPINSTTCPGALNIWIGNWSWVWPRPVGKWQSPGRYSSTIPAYCDLPENEACPGPHHLYPDCLPVYLRLVVTFPECVKLAPLNTTQGMITPTETWYGVTGSPTPPKPHIDQPDTYINCPVDVSSAWLQIPNIQIDPHWQINSTPNSDYVLQSENKTHKNVPDGTGGTFNCTTMHPCVEYDLSNLLLSSDLMMDQMGDVVVPGTTAHADYENGYTQTDIDGLIATCFHETDTPGGVNCGSE